jgi:hypothetical protein
MVDRGFVMEEIIVIIITFDRREFIPVDSFFGWLRRV